MNELMNLMGALLALNAVDYHVLNVARKLLEANELKVALDRLCSILVWRLADSRILTSPNGDWVVSVPCIASVRDGPKSTLYAALQPDFPNVSTSAKSGRSTPRLGTTDMSSQVKWYSPKPTCHGHISPYSPRRGVPVCLPP